MKKGEFLMLWFILILRIHITLVCFYSRKFYERSNFSSSSFPSNSVGCYLDVNLLVSLAWVFSLFSIDFGMHRKSTHLFSIP